MSSPTFKLKSEIVRAGAGAGKTTRLTQQILESVPFLKEELGRWPRLVVTTFTKKATQELKERLIVRASEEQNSEMLSYLSSTSIHISTIHGVLSLFLRRYGHLLGWDNSFEIMTNSEAQRLAKEVLLKVSLRPEWSHLHQKFDFDLLVDLLLDYYEKSLETGCTEFCRFEDFSQMRDQYLAETFVEAKSLVGLFRESGSSKWSEYAEKLEQVIFQFAQNPPSSGEEVLTAISQLGARPRKTKEIDLELSEEVKEKFEQLKDRWGKHFLNTAAWPGFFEIYGDFEKLGQHFVQSFLSEKQLRARIEMRDLELITIDLMRREPELTKAFSQEWDYWLIDEFQDTSPLQDQILNNFICEKPLFLVGDPQQSIYLFRGARSEVFAAKESEMKENASLLMINYRSRPELMNFINDFFASLKQKFAPMGSSPEATQSIDPQEVVAEFFLAPIDTIKEEDEDYNPKAVINGPFEYLRDKIASLLDSGETPENICILARKNVHLLQVVNFLNGYNFPTHLHASSGFYERREIIDASSILRFLANPHDDENLILLLRTPWLHISDQSIYEIRQASRKQTMSLWGASKEYWQLNDELKRGRVRLENLQQFANERGVCKAFEKTIVDWGLFDFSQVYDPTGRRESNLWKLISSLREAEKSLGFNLNKFLQKTDIDLSTSEGGDSDAVAALEPNTIQLMTVHASKGLQFNHVFLLESHRKPDLSGGVRSLNQLHKSENSGRYSFNCPLGEENKYEKSINDFVAIESMQKRELAEHDRLLYVALTRAKKNVYVLGSEKFHKDSWLGRCRFDLSLGEHQKTNYRYRVFNSWESEFKGLASRETGDLDYQLLTEFADTRERWAKVSVSRLVSLDAEEGAKGAGEDAKDERQAEGAKDSSDVAGVQQGSGGQESTEGFLKSNRQLKPGSFLSRNPSLLSKKIQAVTEGVHLHSLFEKLNYNNELNVDEYLHVYFPRSQQKMKKAVNWTLSLASPPMQELIFNGNVEWGFQYLANDKIVEGQIDLWGVVDGVCWVVDYKSGQTKFASQALKQLNYYALALEKMGYKNIKKAIVYPVAEKVVFE